MAYSGERCCQQPRKYVATGEFARLMNGPATPTQRLENLKHIWTIVGSFLDALAFVVCQVSHGNAKECNFLKKYTRGPDEISCFASGEILRESPLSFYSVLTYLQHGRNHYIPRGRRSALPQLQLNNHNFAAQNESSMQSTLHSQLDKQHFVAQCSTRSARPQL